MTITNDDVRRLLQSKTNALLVMIEGRTAMIAPEELDSDAYRGALEIISRDDLLKRTNSAEPPDHEVSDLTATLNVGVSELGA